MNFKLLIPAVLVLIGVNIFNQHKAVAQELDPNILWVADSSIGRIDGFAVHPNGNLFIHRKGVVSEINGTNGELIRVLPKFINSDEIAAIDISKDGRYLAISWVDVVLFDLSDNNFRKVGQGNIVRFTPDSKKLAYGLRTSSKPFEGSIINIFDIESNENIKVQMDEMLSNFAFSPDGRFFATGGSGQDVFGKSYVSLKLWDANTLKLIKELERMENSISPSKIKFSNDSKLVGFWISWANLKIFNTETMSILKNYNQTNTNLEISDFTFISSDYVGVQSNKTSIIRLVDDYVINLLDNSARGFMDINKTNDVLFASTFSPVLSSSIIAFDLNKIFSNVQNKSENTTIQASYQKGFLTISGIQSVSNNVNIEIFDINGKLVHKIDSQPISSEMRVPVILTNGTYLIQIKDMKNVYTSKFLVTE